MDRVPQSVAKRVLLKAYLSSDHVSAATGKTIAVVLSKNGGAFANPSGGATNATEISDGWYYVDLSTTDTGTLGTLVVRGSVATIDDVEVLFEVANAFNAGFTGVPGAAAESAGGLYTRGSGAGQINQPVDGTIDANTVQIEGTDATDYFDTLLAAIVAGVWAAGARTLTSFGSLVSDIATAVWSAGARTLTAFGFTVSATVADKTGFSLASDYDPAKTAAQASDIPTPEEIADILLGRNLGAGSNGGRTVQDALRTMRNKVVISSGVLTVYEEDDTTIAWTGAITSNPAAEPITAVDPS